MTHPYVSPLFGDFRNLPPLLIQAGESEVLRDEITLLAHKASLAGVKVCHEIFEDQVHVFQAFIFLDASRKAFQSQRHFTKHTLPKLLLKKEGDEVGVKGVDYAEIDEEIQQDAHSVDTRGKTEPESLPTSPIEDAGTFSRGPIGAGGHLGGVGVKRDDSFEVANADSDPDSDSPPFTASSSRLPPLTSSRSAQQTLTNVAPSLPHPHTSAHSSTTPPPRPFLRAYSSTRDLLMSQSNPVQAITERLQHCSPAKSTSSETGSLGLENDQKRPLHARSSSHPELRALLVDYESQGPANSTTVYPPVRSFHEDETD